MMNKPSNPELDAREQLIAFAKSFDAAWDRRDLEGFLAHFTPDGTFGGITGSVSCGQTELRRYFGEESFPNQPPGLHHITRPRAFHFPLETIAVVDVDVDMTQDTVDGSQNLLFTFPGVVVLLCNEEGWRVSAIRTGASDLNETSSGEEA